jgi:hypothetical protein
MSIKSILLLKRNDGNGCNVFLKEYDGQPSISGMFYYQEFPNGVKPPKELKKAIDDFEHLYYEDLGKVYKNYLDKYYPDDHFQDCYFIYAGSIANVNHIEDAVTKLKLDFEYAYYYDSNFGWAVYWTGTQNWSFLKPILIMHNESEIFQKYRVDGELK